MSWRGIKWVSSLEDVPQSEPRRYLSDAGYVRLRWKVGTEQYAEVLEHRLVAGFPDGEVHHRNGDKTDNRPENLMVVTKADHARLHGRELTANSKKLNEWGGLKSQQAFEKQQSRLRREEQRQQFVALVKDLHSQGLTTVAIGQKIGRHSSGVSRILRGLQ